MDALVTDSHVRSVIAGIRGLGRAGLEVVALGPRRSAAGRWSRYATARAVGPEVLSHPRELATRVGELAREHGPLVVYPGREEAIDALVDHPLPSEAILPYSGPEALALLRDKPKLADLARAAGLEVPSTLLEATARELANASSPPVPCAIKPAYSGNRNTLGGTRLFDSAEELRAVMGALPNPEEPMLVQERTGGPLTSLAVVLDRSGGLVARFQQSSTETWPAAAGASAWAVSVEPDDELASAVARMLAAAGYWGMAQVQFLRGARGPVVIDVNPRFFGSLPLALTAGVNLPAAWHQVVHDRPVAAQQPYRVGVTYRWVQADVSAALGGMPKRLLRRAPRPRAGAFWASDDPVAGALMAVDTAAEFVKRRLPAAKRGAPTAASTGAPILGLGG